MTHGKVDLKGMLSVLRSADTIVTPRLNQYLLSGKFDEPIPLDIAQIVHEQLAQVKRVRTGTFSSSSAGRCLRRQEFEFMDIDTGGVYDPRLANIFSDGRWRHLRWQVMLLHAGIIEQIEVATPWPRMNAWSTLDGIGYVPDDHPHVSWRGKEFGWELKGMNSHLWRKVKADDEMKEDHLNQVHRYFLMRGCELFSIIIENKDTQEWIEKVVEADPDRLEQQEQELQTLNSDLQSGFLSTRLPECQRQTGLTFQQCPFGGKRGVCVTAPDNKWPTKKQQVGLSGL